jgi:calcium/calmodulin-dependent protein kinase (CaM kinase) II
MTDSTVEELLRLNQRLLDAIASGDWAVYQELCDPTLTAFEPEALGQLVEGLDFHRFYFDIGSFRSQHRTTMCSPHVRVLGDVAVVAYVRLNQRVGDNAAPVTVGFEETRVWHRQDGRWRHVHFHRSPLART